MIRKYLFGVVLLISICLVGCSSNTTNNITDTTIGIPETLAINNNESDEVSYFVKGFHDVVIDMGTDPKILFDELMKDVNVYGYTLNISEVQITIPGEYSAYWISNDGLDTKTCKVTVNKIDLPEPNTEESTVAQVQNQPQVEQPLQTQEQQTTQPVEQPIQSILDQQTPVSKSISGVHDVTHSWSDESWSAQSVAIEIQSGVTSNDLIMLDLSSAGVIDGPGTYPFTWLYSDGSVAATCYLYVTD